MEFRVLGSIEVRAAGLRMDIGHARQRAVLAVLLFDLGRVVPTTQLIDRVWGDDPPVSVRNALYGYVAKLRAAIAATGEQDVTLSRQPGGYRLEADQDQVDLYRFRRLVEEAAAAAGDDDRAGVLLAQAVALWRGPALGDTDSFWLNGMREPLEAQRRTAVLDLGDIRLRQGQHRALAASLAGEAVTCPADERLIGQLMVALYRSGRQAEALQWFERTRRRLAEEFGADPGPQLRALHRQILRAGAEPESARALADQYGRLPAALRAAADIATARRDMLQADLAGEPGLGFRRLPAGYDAGRRRHPSGIAGACGRVFQVADGHLSGPRATAPACRGGHAGHHGGYHVPAGRAGRPSGPPLARRNRWLGRARKLARLTAAAVAAASLIFAAVLWGRFSAGRTLYLAGLFPVTRTSPNGTVLGDGVNPMQAACGRGAVILTSAPVSATASSGVVVGLLQILYSSACHSTWARFEFTPAGRKPAVPVFLWQRRTSDSMTETIHGTTLRTAYTGMLLASHSCVQAAVLIMLPKDPWYPATTGCVTVPAGPRTGT